MEVFTDSQDLALEGFHIEHSILNKNLTEIVIDLVLKFDWISRIIHNNNQTFSIGLSFKKTEYLE